MGRPGRRRHGVPRTIDVAAARERGVVVCGTGSLPSPTAELTWALILAPLRHVPAEDARIRAGGWQATVGTELAGRTLGVIGLGRLGRRVARVARAFEMDVLTPHLGYVTRGTYARFFADAVEDIAAFQRGAPVRVLDA